MSGNAADVAQTSWLASLEARLDSLWAWVTSLWATITAWIASVYTAFVAWITPIVTWLQATVGWLLNLYNTWVKPYLDWVINAVNIVSNTITVVRAVLEQRIDDVFNFLFADIVKLRDVVREGLTNLGSAVAIVNEELGNRIIEQGLRFDFEILKVAQEVRSELLIRMDELFYPLESKVGEITAVIRNIIDFIEDNFRKISALIGPTLEKPGLLSKNTVVVTGHKYGRELWDSIMDIYTEEVSELPTETIPSNEQQQLMDRHIALMRQGPGGEYGDLIRRIDEEIYEIYTGRTLAKKTEIVVPAYGKDLWEEELETHKRSHGVTGEWEDVEKEVFDKRQSVMTLKGWF